MHEELDKFTENLVKSLVSDPDMVKIQEFSGDDGLIQLEILVPEEDMGILIGRGGKMAQSIRILVQAVAYKNGNNKVTVNIDSY